MAKTRNFYIPTRPFTTNRKLYKRSNITLNAGLTVLVGCNGSGKTTLLDYIKDELAEKKIPYLFYDNFMDEGEKAEHKIFSQRGFKTMISSLFYLSEGENIISNLNEMAEKIARFIETNGKEDEQREQITRNIENFSQDDYGQNVKTVSQNEKNEMWFLFDSIDSGMSIDNVVGIRTLLLDPLAAGILDPDVYVVVSANAYETCRNAPCFSVQDGKYLTFSDYEEYRKFILKTREYKEKCVSQK